MSMFTEWLKSVGDEANTLFSRFTNKTQFRRLVSACYLIAQADGHFDAEEKQGIAKLIQRQLPNFTIADILSVINDCEATMAFDPQLGAQEIRDNIAKCSTEEAQSIIRACCYIGAADGDFDDDEKRVARDLAIACNLDPGRYGL